MGILTIPKIEWDTGPKTLAFPNLPLDNPRAWREPAPGSEWAEGPSGSVSAWVTGTWHLLEGIVRHIPTTTTGGVTGWDDTNGWLDFLEYAWAGNGFDFFPDATLGTSIPCVLVAPRSEFGALDDASIQRNLTIRLRSTDGTNFDGYGL